VCKIADFRREASMQRGEMKEISYYFKKVTACFIALAMCFDGYAAYALPGLSSPTVASFDTQINLLDVSVPKEIGSIKEKFEGEDDKVVFIIQDAHAIPDAQRSIQKLIEYSQKKYGVGLVALEGAASDLNAQIFKSFPDKELLKKIFEGYFDRGELAGGTAAAIFSESPSTYHGIEDWALYQAGLRYFLNAMELESAITSQLAELFEELQAEKQKAYSEKLLSIDQALRTFHQNASDIMTIQCRCRYPHFGARTIYA